MKDGKVLYSKGFGYANLEYDIKNTPQTIFHIASVSKQFTGFAIAMLADQGKVSMEDDVPLSAFGYHKLIPESGKAALKEWMTIIQHPGGARRQYAIRENQCVKDDDPDILWYMSDTAQGSSGAPVFNDSLQVVALHRMGVANKNKQGRYVLKDKTVVANIDDRDDSEVDWIANMGVRVSRICESIRTGCS